MHSHDAMSIIHYTKATTTKLPSLPQDGQTAHVLLRGALSARSYLSPLRTMQIPGGRGERREHKRES